VRWLLDECVDAALVTQLRELGHDVAYMSDVAPRATDAEVMRHAHNEHRLLLTEDKDFGDLVFRQARPVPGIVLLRIDSSRRSIKGARLQAAIDRFGESLFDRYTVIEDARFRSRPLLLSRYGRETSVKRLAGDARSHRMRGAPHRRGLRGSW
jgi:predicted nuclease of predicted toxin-antitoxin system